MKELNFEQMEQIKGGGWAMCAYGVASMVVAVGCVATGPIGGWAVAGFAFGWIGGGVTAAIECGESLADMV